MSDEELFFGTCEKEKKVENSMVAKNTEG